MPSRFNYSRWDGTQRGFDFDAQSLIDELTDDLVHHGDVNAALRRMMHDGMRNDRGEQMMGLREMMKKLRDKKNEIKRGGPRTSLLSCNNKTNFYRRWAHRAQIRANSK